MGKTSSVTLGHQFFRSRVAEAAMAVFTEKGFEDTTVADLLEAAGIARRTFYRHFSSKDDVLLELYEIVTRALMVEMAEATMTASDPWSGALHGLDTYLAFHLNNRKLLLAILTESRRESSPLYAPRQRSRQALVAQLTSVLSLRSGRAYDPLVSEALFGSLDALSSLLLRPEAGLETLARVRAVTRGLLELASAPGGPLPAAPTQTSALP
jgi:AcrR family transcriptional regulator